ncbi:DgyrCDS12018 [Dimorphilus gyrociliatus]|uniref:DgyrCDS12018 n=1 Tax=Dimorphilus gyrociliatus TaxID=2664684 RepID=A0A7I8W5C7_9ANNE|nr:DgyrCDS12018 [Dimorphilus gyrociliatus]
MIRKKRYTFDKKVPANKDCWLYDFDDGLILTEYRNADRDIMPKQNFTNDYSGTKLTRYQYHSSDGFLNRTTSDDVNLSRSHMTFTTFGKRNSHASDTSSAYSGSDVMQSSISGEINADLSGLSETLVDSDEEESYLDFGETSLMRDNVREILEKERKERTEEDIDVLLENFQHLPAFANMTLATRRELCKVMVFAVVEKSNTIVLQNGEQLDSWSVILNGHVEVEKMDKTISHLHMGDSFGITPSRNVQKHIGIMKTKVDNCQFLCIDQENYYRILTQGEQNTVRHEENDKVVLVTEYRVLDAGSKSGYIVIRGTNEKLMWQLVQEHSTVDPTYVEDFLLTCRTFLKSPTELTCKLLDWFDDKRLRDRVTRVVLLWVNNHFNDFENEACMSEFLEKFENLLRHEGMNGQLRLLNIACSTKARTRIIKICKCEKYEDLKFKIIGGYDKAAPIFVASVQKNSKAYEAGLKRADQILEVNNTDFENISEKGAEDILRGSMHLSITVKSNLMSFNELLQETTETFAARRLSSGSRSSSSSCDSLAQRTKPVVRTPSAGKEVVKKKGFISSGPKALRLRKALMKLYTKPKSEIIDDRASDDGRLRRSLSSSSSSRLNLSASNPDLSSLCLDDSDIRTVHDSVIKVFKSDQTFKLICLNKQTTAHQTVLASLKQFGITENCSNYSLCEVTVESEDVVKQRRLPDQLTNLAERSSLNGRYYIKENSETQPLIPDEQKYELLAESRSPLLQLQAAEVAAQLTLNDFHLFHQIQSTEYIDELFDRSSRFGTPNLTPFVRLVNKETYWVVTEVLNESNLIRRVKLLKHFIKIARHCRELKNFNSMFAIVSGLDHTHVTRLHSTWEKVNHKHMQWLEEMKDILNPIRNFANYRNIVSSERVQPPMIPFFPLLKKDLSFIHLGNDDKVDGLINFEKMRMLAKEIRNACNMATVHSSLQPLFFKGQPASTAHSDKIFSAFGCRDQSTNSTPTVATLRRKRRSSSTINLKKMYDDTLMVRKSRDYLSKIKVIENTDVLRDLSFQCENNQGSSQSLKRDQASSPNLAPHAFGVDNVDNVNKLISLRSKTRPHNDKHNPIPRHALSPQANHRPPPRPPKTTSNDSDSGNNSVSSVESHFSETRQEIRPPLPSYDDAVKQLSTNSRLSGTKRCTSRPPLPRYEDAIHQQRIAKNIGSHGSQASSTTNSKSPMRTPIMERLKASRLSKP